MTGLGAGDTGPTGDLQVQVDEPEPDSLPAQVGQKPSHLTLVHQMSLLTANPQILPDTMLIMQAEFLASTVQTSV